MKYSLVCLKLRLVSLAFLEQTLQVRLEILILDTMTPWSQLHLHLECFVVVF